MAHFAKISLDKKVLQVLTVNDSDTMDVNGQENEVIGQKYLEKHNNWPAHLWVKTSYNTTANKHLQNKNPYRGNYAGIGDEWDEENQIFWKQNFRYFLQYIVSMSLSLLKMDHFWAVTSILYPFLGQKSSLEPLF